MEKKSFHILKIIELRKITNLGVIECKNALELNKWDIYNSLKFLKKKWNKISENKFNNKNLNNNNGIVIANTNNTNTIGSIIVLNCESDFVCKNQNFLELAKYISKISLLCKDELSILNFRIEQKNCYIKDIISELMGSMKENISFYFKKISSPFVSFYNHTGNKISSIVSFSTYLKGLDIIGKNIAMQIVAMEPNCIYNNKYNDYQSDRELISLMDQNFIKNTNISVKEYIKNFNNNLDILDFKIVKLYK